MSEMFELVESNKDKILDELPVAIERALEAVGLQVEKYAKMNCPVDTGLLRNSITHAVSGKPAAIKTYTAGDSKGKALKGGKLVKDKGGKSVAAITSGSYSGVAPSDTPNTVYIGTNVEYAPYVEEGHMTPSGKSIPGEHFLEHAITGHKSQLKKLAERALEGF